jgi:hypothetical protein
MTTPGFLGGKSGCRHGNSTQNDAQLRREPESSWFSSPWTGCIFGSMERERPSYDPQDGLDERRRRRRTERGSPGLAFAYIVLLAVVLGLALGCPEGEKTVASTTTTGLEGATTTSESPTSAPADGPLTYAAALTGDAEVPPVSTSATGTLTFTVADDGSKVDYVFDVTDLVGVQIARLREGKSGENGESIMILYDGPKSESFSGVLAQGSFTAADLEGSLKGKTIEDLVTMILAGSVYFNVGTLGHSAGEIRGQLR